MLNPSDERLGRAHKILESLGQDKPAQRGVVAHLAARWAVSLGDPSQADQLFRQALGVLPALRPSIRGIQRVILQGGEKKKVLEWLDLQIRATSHPREAAALYRERGRLIEQIFGDLKATRQCHEAALLAAPNDLSALFSLFHTHERSGNLEASKQALQKIAESIHDDAYRAVLEHTCALLSLPLHEPNQEILDRLSWAVQHAPGSPIITHDAFRIAQKVGNAADMLGFLKVELALRKGRNAQGPTLWRIANILQQHGYHKDALRMLRHASQCHPQRLHLCDQLYTAAIAAKSNNLAVSAAISRIRILQNAERPWQANAWYDLADRLLSRDVHNEQALGCLQRTIALDPTHKAAAYRYLEALREQERFDEFVQKVRQWCDEPSAGAQPNEKAAWLEDAATVCFRHLHQPALGQSLLKRAQEHAPQNPSIRAALERIYFDEDDAASLRALYREDLDRNEDPDREVLLRTLLCHVVPEIQDTDLAIQDNRGLLELKPDCVTTIQQLARLLSTTGDKQALLEITLQESKLDLPERKRADLMARAGDIALGLKNPALAQSYFEQSLALDPTHDGARSALEGQARQNDDRSALLEHLQCQLEQNPDSAGLRLEIADLLLESGPFASEALDVLSPLVDGVSSSFCALRIGEKILSSLGEYRRALEFMDRRVAMLEGNHARALLLTRSAWLRWRHLNDQNSALEDLWRASTLAPSLHVVRWMLFELLAQQGSSRVWPWLRQQLQSSDRAPGMEPLVTRWLVRDPPANQLVEWLTLDQSRIPDGPSQCLSWIDPARRCHAHRLQAGVIDRYLQDRPPRPQDPRRMMLRYFSARAHALCQDWELARSQFEDLSTWEVGHQDIQGSIAQRTYETIADRDQALISMVGRLKHQRTEQRSRAVRLHSSLSIIDLLAQAGEWKDAIRRCEQLIATTPRYLPAHYLYIDCLERQGQNAGLSKIADAYLALAQQHTQQDLRAKALRAAGRRYLDLAMQDKQYREPAWKMGQEAFEISPEADEAFHLLWECAVALNQSSSNVRLVKPMLARANLLQTRDAAPDEFVAIASLAERLFPVASCTEVLTYLVDKRPKITVLHLLLARSQARQQSWDAAVQSVEQALQLEKSRKRKGALHYFLGDLQSQAGRLTDAIEHYMLAAKLDYRVDAAGQAAAQLASDYQRYDQQVLALELMVERGRRQDRPRYMRELADLYRGPLDRVDRAIDLIARLVSSSPDDSDAVALLYQLLEHAERHQEAKATLRVATTRLQNKFRSRTNIHAEHRLPIQAIHGLRRFFELDNETDGVYLATAVIEIIAPNTLQGPGCDVLRSEPWSLPTPGTISLLPALLREIPSAFALRRLVHLWPNLPALPEINRALPSGSKILSPDRDASRVVHSLGALLGLRRIHVAVNLREEEQVLARWSPDGTPTLILGRRVYNAPIAPRSRDTIGRALWRLATGGDCIREVLCEQQRRALALLPDLMEGRFELSAEDEAWVDASYARDCLARLPQNLPYSPLTDVRERSRQAMMRSILPFDASLDSAEDRFGAICTGDPRIALAQCAKLSESSPERYTDLIAYTLSNAHLVLRRELGYQHLVELDVHDLEVLAL